MKSLLNIFWLGIKEIRSLMSDVVMVGFVVYAFTLAIYVQATGTSSEVNNASIAFADEDGSALSKELFNAFYPPRFKFPEALSAEAAQRRMDDGRLMFVVVIPPRFERDLRAGRNPTLQVNIDATAMQQAGIGAGYIRNIINDRVSSFLRRTDVPGQPKPINLVIRKLFNPNGVSSWFKSVVAIINQISLLTVVLTGAAVIREREHGTLTQAPAFPGHAARARSEIAMAKVWANSLRDPDRDRRLAFSGRADGPQGAVRRLGRPLVRRRRALPVLRDGAGDLPGDDLALDGAVRAAHHPRDRSAHAAVGREHARREPAEVAADPDLPAAVAALRQLLAGDHLPGRRQASRGPGCTSSSW